MQEILKQFAEGDFLDILETEWVEVDPFEWSKGEKFANLYDTFPAFVQCGTRTAQENIYSGVMFRLPDGTTGHYGARLNPYRGETHHLFVPA